MFFQALFMMRSPHSSNSTCELHHLLRWPTNGASQITFQHVSMEQEPGSLRGISMGRRRGSRSFNVSSVKVKGRFKTLIQMAYRLKSVLQTTQTGLATLFKFNPLGDFSFARGTATLRFEFQIGQPSHRTNQFLTRLLIRGAGVLSTARARLTIRYRINQKAQAA